MGKTAAAAVAMQIRKSPPVVAGAAHPAAALGTKLGEEEWV